MPLQVDGNALDVISSHSPMEGYRSGNFSADSVSSLASRPIHRCTLLNVRRDEVTGFVEFHPLIDLNCGSCGQRSGGRFTAKHSSKRSRTNHSRSKNPISNLIAVFNAWLPAPIHYDPAPVDCLGLAHRASAYAGYSSPNTFPGEMEQFSPVIAMDLISTILFVMGLPD